MNWNDNDMLAFAEMCGTRGECGFRVNGGKWLIDDIHEASTADLLESFKRMRIPPLPDPNDLEHLKLGIESDNKTKY